MSISCTARGQPSWTAASAEPADLCPKGRTIGEENRGFPAVNRIIWSVDYPYLTLDGTREFLGKLPVSEQDLEKIAVDSATRPGPQGSPTFSCSAALVTTTKA